MPELAAALAVSGERCGETDLADALAARYSGSREFDSEVRFRRDSEPTDPPPEACAWARERGRELARLDGQADAQPWPGHDGGELGDSSHRRFLAVRAGAVAARVWLCGRNDLTIRLSAAYPTDVDFQHAFLTSQQAGLDVDRPLQCHDSERRARQLVVVLQSLELPRAAEPASGEIRVHCLLPGLRATVPMTGPMAVSDCAERRGKAFHAFTKFDDDYEPDAQPERE